MNDMRKLMESIDEAYFGKAEPSTIENEMSMDEIAEIAKQHGIDRDEMQDVLIYAHSNDLFWEMALEVVNSRGQRIDRFESLTDVPQYVIDHDSGEKVETTMDNIHVIYNTTPEKVAEMLGWYKDTVGKDKQAKHDKSFDNWLDQNPFESIEEAEGDIVGLHVSVDANDRNTRLYLPRAIRSIMKDFNIGTKGKTLVSPHPHADNGVVVRMQFDMPPERKNFGTLDVSKAIYNKLRHAGWNVDSYPTWVGGGINVFVSNDNPTGNPTLRTDEVEGNEESINDQIRSLLKQGKKVISRAAGAVGEVLDIDDRGIATIQHPPETRRGKSVTNFNAFDNIEIVGNIDHYDIVQHWDEGIDEGVGDWIKRLDHKAGDWVGAKAAKHMAKKVAQAVDQEGLDDIGFDMSYGDKKGRDAMRDGLELYLKNEPNGEYAEQVRYILPVIAKERAKWDDIIRQGEEAFGGFAESLDEGVGRVVEVPPELRGNSEMTGDASSEDAMRFIDDLGPDDQVSHEVVDPETGELLDWPSNFDIHGEKRLTKRERGKTDWEKRQAEREQQEGWDDPIYHLRQSSEYTDNEDGAFDLINELRNDEFYNVVWRDVEDLVDDPDYFYDRDYDIGMQIPVALKRTDGKRLSDQDHDNIKEVAKAIKQASTMNNIGLGFSGTSNEGTTARFYPTFM